jgi:hypothetical protein
VSQHARVVSAAAAAATAAGVGGILAGRRRSR